MNPAGQEQPTLHQKLNRLEDMIVAIENKVMQRDTLATGGIPVVPQSMHVLENVGNRIDDASARLEGILKAVTLL